MSLKKNNPKQKKQNKKKMVPVATHTILVFVSAAGTQVAKYIDLGVWEHWGDPDFGRNLRSM